MTSKQTYLSGAQKRKKQREREEAVKKLTKIDVFFKDAVGAGRSGCSDDSSKGTDLAQPICSKVSEDAPVQELLSESDPNTEDMDLIDTDRGRFTGELSENLKNKIVNLEPHQPKGPFPKDPVTNRSFSSHYYHVKTKTGQVIHRFWLCYSLILNAVYCHVCWLFSDRLNKNFSDAWCNGTIKDWQGLAKKIESTKHLTITSHPV